VKFTWRFALLALVLPAFMTQSTWAASTKDEVMELQDDVAALKDGQAAIQKELAEIKKLLEQGARAAPSAPAFKPADVTIGDSPVLGDPNATVTLMEFSDFQCPFCSRHYREVMPTLLKDYVDSGQLKYVMRENPISSIHSRALPASQAALCAKDQGKYWEMHNLLFDNQKQLSDEDLKGRAVTLGLDTAAFNDCFDSKAHEKVINDDLAAARSLGVRGTPSFVIGITDPDDPDKAHMTEFINGAQSLDKFKEAIDKVLEAAKEG